VARILVIILLAYAVIIGLGETAAGGPGRLLLLGYLLGEAVRPLGRARPIVWVASALMIAAAIWVGAVAPAAVASGLVGAFSLVLTAAIITVVAVRIRRHGRVDTPTVLGVLSVYLLLALLFESLNQLFAAFDPDHYLHGVTGLPTASDQLYFSVITMATVGYGDIVPGSELARSVAVVEALTGQLYLVSVVAIVVGNWRRDS